MVGVALCRRGRPGRRNRNRVIVAVAQSLWGCWSLPAEGLSFAELYRSRICPTDRRRSA